MDQIKSGLTGVIVKALFLLVAACVYTWSGWLTLSFAAIALPGASIFVLAMVLVLFDVGSVAWLAVFIHHAKGMGQRAVAITVSVIDFAGMGIMTAAEILLGGQVLMEVPANMGKIAIVTIAAATIINAGGVYLFHALDPENIQRIKDQNRSDIKRAALNAHKDKIFFGGLEVAAEQLDQDQQWLAKEAGVRMRTQLLSEINADRDGDGRPDLFQQGAPTSQPLAAHGRANYQGEYITHQPTAFASTSGGGAPTMSQNGVQAVQIDPM